MRRTVLLPGVFILIAACLPLAQGGMVKDGLIANWSFDRDTVIGDTVKDLAGNYDAKMMGGPKIVAGKHGQAIEFDGVDDYVNLTILKGFGPKLGTFSMDLWIKIESAPEILTLFKTLNDGGSMGWAIDLDRSALPGFAYAKGVTHFYVRDGKGKHLPAEIEADIYDDEWHHIGWVVEDASSDTCKIYIDGEEQDVVYGDVQAPKEFIEFQHPVVLGGGNNRGTIGWFCKPTVDEFRIYTKALTEQEILQNFASGAAVESSEKLPVTWGTLKTVR